VGVGVTARLGVGQHVIKSLILSQNYGGGDDIGSPLNLDDDDDDGEDILDPDVSMTGGSAAGSDR
jgi:hypothetical protein